jgi:hypothetical protein
MAVLIKCSADPSLVWAAQGDSNGVLLCFALLRFLSEVQRLSQVLNPNKMHVRLVSGQRNVVQAPYQDKLL